MTTEDANMQRFASTLDNIADEVAAMKADQAKALYPRQPSMAAAIYGGPATSPSNNGGRFLLGIAKARSRDAFEQSEGKSMLDSLATRYVAWEETGAKASLGTSDATGGWIIPNSVVDDFVKPSAFKNVYRELMTVRAGVRSFAVDVPFRSAQPARAFIAAFGATKENVDLAYNGYTATMYTLARIHDIGAQFLRQSAGAAEADVMQELASAMGRGEAFYIRDGTGSSQPYGYVAAATNGPSTFRTTFTPSATTLAGSVLSAIGQAAGDLMARGRTPEAAVISPDVYKLVVTQGTDTAGFFINGTNGVNFPAFKPGTLMTPFGIPIHVDMDAASDDLFVGEWSALRIYLGENYRVDSSDVAGTRWDTNLVGFRGEEEMGFDARPAVYAGCLQMVTDVTP